MSPNTSAIDGTGYDMDSSLIFCDLNDGSTFFNSVDNPLTAKDFQIIKNKSLYSNIHLLTLPCGSACEYPQAYLGIDREAEKNRLKKINYQNLKKSLEAIDCKYFTNAGGEYQICSSMFALEKYKVYQSEIDLKELSNEVNSNYLFHYESNEVIINNGDVSINKFEKNFRTNENNKEYYSKILDNAKSIQHNKKINTKEFLPNHKNKIIRKLNSAKAKLLNTLNGQISGFDHNLNIYLSLYQYLPSINSESEFLKIHDEALIKFELLRSKNSEGTRNLNLHTSIDLIEDCLDRVTSWNTALTSSSIIIERTPNIFVPSDQEIINYAVVM